MRTNLPRIARNRNRLGSLPGPSTPRSSLMSGFGRRVTIQRGRSGERRAQLLCRSLHVGFGEFSPWPGRTSILMSSSCSASTVQRNSPMPYCLWRKTRIIEKSLSCCVSTGRKNDVGCAGQPHRVAPTWAWRWLRFQIGGRGGRYRKWPLATAN